VAAFIVLPFEEVFAQSTAAPTVHLTPQQHRQMFEIRYKGKPCQKTSIDAAEDDKKLVLNV
jgi:hypothetical protein